MTAAPYHQAVEEVIRAFAEGARLAVSAQDIAIPEPEQGDLAISTFRFTKHADLPPPVFASVAAVAVNNWLKANPQTFVDRVEAVGPYLNLWLKREAFAEAAVRTIRERGADYGKQPKTTERTVLEYVSPNTNKPLHLGHLRNAVIGWSVAKLLEYRGDEIVKTAIINDRGADMMKAVLAYQKWSEAWDGKHLIHETPQSAKMKSDAFVGKYYVTFQQKAKDDHHVTEEVHETLRRWEAGDETVRALWKKLTTWALKGHQETYKRIGISFDKLYYESLLYQEGRQIVEAQLAKGTVHKVPNGALAIDLSEEGLGQKILLRADGTSVYITQDIALVEHRIADFHPRRIVYVVGQEQDYQFRALFAVLKRFGLAVDVELAHLSYHLVLLPEGRMKSREGTIVEIDDLLDDLAAMAADEVTNRHEKISSAEAKRRADAIALAAVKYFFLKVRPDSDIHFDPKQSLQFTGRTGPYLLYTCARIASIFKKRGETNHASNEAEPAPPHDLTPEEWQLVRILARFPVITERAAADYDPSLLADFTYDLTKAVNDFYESSPVLKAEPAVRAWRLALLTATQTVLASCFEILGIEPLEEM